MFHELAPTSSSSLGSTHHVEAAGRAESELAEGGKKNKKAKGGGEKKKKALKKTELAKLYFKVGWHIRGTSSYSSAFLRGYICARSAASKKSILFKAEQTETKHSPPCSQA